ncbi:MAG: hypoxanthine phosphoribosyltransferase [SAR324 cluster bacterium]|nr:hypoxanthine phosphoribosyltransferase [SAR324 cluster bacterium]MBL7035815.1 hypoxanthine phosphoribosyltransferase [SAR324 cluster bacterium]
MANEQIDFSKHEILLSSSEIKLRVEELGRQISADYRDRELHLVGVLNGAFIFLADLVRQIDIPCQICFLQASSYKDQKLSSGEVTLMHNLDLSGKEVLVVEDIFDTGLTLKYIFEDLQQQKPKSLEACALLSKQIPDKEAVEVKYIGFEIEDRFVVGYGLDFAEKYREIPHIACLD